MSANLFRVATQGKHMATELMAFVSASKPALPARVRAALAGELDAETLTDAERELFDDAYGDALNTPTAAAVEFWENFDRSTNTDL